MSKFGATTNPENLLIGKFTPKQQHRFLLSFADGYSLPAFLIKSLDRPTLNIGKITHEYGNKKVHFAGKAEWQDINLVLLDPIDVSASAKIMEWVHLEHEALTGVDGYPAEYKKDLTINVLGAYGETVEEWTLRGAFITSVDFSNSDSSSADFHTLSITLSIDDAIWEY